MPPRWLHNTLDLTVFGRVYDHLHAWKDEPSRWLGPRHRIERHPWYQLYGLMWNLDDALPECIQTETARLLATEGADVAESFQADVAHDCYDRTWDTLSQEDRAGICGAFKWLLQQPGVLLDKFGIDVYSGRILIEHPDGRTEWQDEPGLNRAWRELKVYTEGRPIEDLLIGK